MNAVTCTSAFFTLHRNRDCIRTLQTEDSARDPIHAKRQITTLLALQGNPELVCERMPRLPLVSRLMRE
jgi:hypothetical protein